MKTHMIALTLFIAAALAVAAYLVSLRSQTGPVIAEGVGQNVLPLLASKLNDAAEVSILRSGESFTFKRTEDGWTLAQKDNYPVKGENIRAMLIALSQLKAVEAKTTKPELYPRIGVQDPGTPTTAAAEPEAPDAQPPTQPSLLTIADAAGQTLGSIIIGSQKWGVGTTPEVYVRRAGEAQSWLAAGGRVDVPWEALAWVDRQFLNIPREKWKSVTVTHTDGQTLTSMRVAPTQANFFIENIPDGRALTSPTAGDSLGGAFTGLSLDDVKAASTLNHALLASATRTVGTTFDGLVITARTFELDGRKWSVFEAAAENPDEQPDATAQANELNAKLSKWVFALPEFKSKALLTRWEDVLRPSAPPAAAASEPDLDPAIEPEPIEDAQDPDEVPLPTPG